MKQKSNSRFLIKSISSLFALGAFANISYAQTTRTWDGGGVGDTNMDTAANWSGDVVPTGAAPGDTAQWNGSVTGPLSLTYTAAGTGAGLGAGNGLFLSVLGTQTDSLTINEASGTAAIRLQNLTIASGAGAFTYGGSDSTIDGITLGSGAVSTHVLTNNSSNAATFGTDVRFAFGGGAAKTVTFDGSGNWNFNAKFGNGGTGSVTSVAKKGAGTLTINNNIQGTNSGSAVVNPGNIFVNAGTMVVDNNGVVTTSNFSSVGQSGTDVATMTLKGTGSFISGNDFNVGDVGSSAGTLNVQDTASLSVGTGGGFFIASANTGGSTASGVVNHSAGTVAVTSNADGRLIIGGRNAAAGTGGTGTYNLSGTGLLTNAGNAFIGGYGKGTFTQTSGTFSNAGWVSIARQTASIGSYTISGGLLSQSGAGMGIVVGELGTGTLTVTGGSVTASGTSTLRVGNGVGGNGTVQLKGGTITTAKVDTGGGTGTFNFDGGTLKANATGATFFQGLTTTNVRNGGALVDTNTFNVTIAQPLLHSTIGGDAAMDGGLIKSGLGALTLGGANTYNGPTTISADTLVFGGTSTTGNILVADGATVGGKVTNPGTSAVSNTNNPSLTFGTAGATNLSVDFSTLGNPTVPVLNLGTGVATLNGVVSVSLSNTTALTSTPNNTTLALVSYASKSGSGSWNLATTTVGHSSFALNPTANTLYLSVSSNPVTWTGAASNAWNDDTLAAPKNWKLPAQTDFINGDTVFFTNTATAFNVDITENVNPGIVTFTNTSNAYTIGSTGGFGITSGSISVNGGGSVTLGGNNSYTGATTINSGTLTLTGSLTASAVTLNAGTLNVNSNTAFGPAPLTINSGTLDSTVANIILSANPAENWNGDFTFAGTNGLDLGTGAVTLGGIGDRTVTVSGTLAVGEIKSAGLQGFTKQGTGTLVVTSDGSGAAASVVNNFLNVSAGTLQINRATGNNGDFLAAGVIGGGNVTNGAAAERWLFSNAAAGTFTFSGTLSNGAAGALGFNKSGASTQTLSGNNTYSGVTSVAGGTLNVSGANSLSGATNITGGTLNITGSNSAGGAVSVNGSAATPAYLQLQNGNALGTCVVTSTNRNSGIQLQGGINIPNTVTFITSNDGTTGATVPYVFDNVSGDNTINGSIALTSGGGSSIIQSDSGSLTLTGNITIAAAQTSRGIVLQGSSTGANTFSGVLSDLSGTATASIIKNGTGTWTLTGGNTYTGTTAINAGTLVVSGNNFAASGAVTVATDATLGGNGNLGGAVTIAAGGIHSLAVAATPGAQVTRIITGLLTNTTGSILNLTAASAPAPGVYTLVTAAGGISALPTTVTGFTGGVVSISGNNLILTVSSASAYDSWASAKGLTSANNGATQDPDSDGVSNLLEFVLDGNPLASDTTKLPKSSQDATNFYFDFDRRDDSVGEATLTFESGTTLVAWPTSIAIPSSNTPAAGPPVTITDNGGGTHHLKVTVAKSGNTTLFGRLKAVK